MSSFSAVLINYNHADYLPNALDAALHQTIPFDEILIIDDASTDQSVRVIERLIKGVPHARLVQNEHNLGIIGTLNRGLHEAKGDFILYLSANDIYEKKILEWCKPLIQHHPDIAMVCGNVRVHNRHTGQERSLTLPLSEGRHTYAAIATLARKRNFTFFGGATLIKRDALLAAGGQVQRLKWHADWFLYLLLAYRHPFLVVQQDFTCITQEDSQYSHACYDWNKQKPVIEAFVHTLQQDYPDTYHFFRTCALLPTYDIQALFLFLRNRTIYCYLTPLLIWRLLTYKLLRNIGRKVPHHWHKALRAWVRV